ncbi:MAG: hypothetical protein SOR23_06305 [Candidatus Enterosoma sp.]|nr:hypothetical protein [Candidatus Enterosoma sp.]
MRNKKIIKSILLLPILSTLITSCGDESNKTSDKKTDAPITTDTTHTTENNTSSPSTDNNQPKPNTLNKETLAKMLNNIIEAKSFAIQKTCIENTDEGDFTDVFTERYVHLESKKLSHILMKNLIDDTIASSYTFGIEEGSLSLRSIDSKSVNGEYQVLDELSSFNPLNSYKDQKTGKGLITTNDILLSVDDYVVNDFGLVLTLSTLLNLKERAANSQFVYAKFALDQNQNLTFTLVRSTDGMSFTDYATGTFLDINTAASDMEESLLKNPYSYKKISSALLNSIKKDTYSFANAFEQTYPDDLGWTLDKGIYQIEQDKIHLKADGEETFYVKKNDVAVEQYLNGLNEITEVDTGIKWSSFNYLNDYLSEASLLQVSSDTYRYVGNDPFKVFNAITGTKSLGSNDIDYIDFTVKNSKITNIYTKFISDLDTANFLTDVWYDVTTTVGDVAVSLPKPLKPIKEDNLTETVTKTLSYFKDTFEVEMYDKLAKSLSTKYTFINNGPDSYILRDELYTKPGETALSHKKTGYGLNANGDVVEYLYTSNGSVFALNEPVKGKELSSFINMDISPVLFQKGTFEDKAYIKLRTDIKDIDSHLLGYNHIKDVNVDTFKFYYNDNKSKKPLSYTYHYSYNNGQSKGEEFVNVLGLGNTEVETEEGLSEKIKVLTSFVAPTTWEMEESVYGELVSLLGEERAKLVPYVYEKSLFDKWYGYVNKAQRKMTIYIPDTQFDFDDKTNYMGRLEEMIKANTSFKADTNDKGNKVYYYYDGTSYTLGISLSDNPKDGFDVFIPD